MDKFNEIFESKVGTTAERIVSNLKSNWTEEELQVAIEVYKQYLLTLWDIAGRLFNESNEQEDSTILIGSN